MKWGKRLYPRSLFGSPDQEECLVMNDKPKICSAIIDEHISTVKVIQLLVLTLYYTLMYHSYL